MGDLLKEAIAIWEGEGGALPAIATTPISAGNPVEAALHAKGRPSVILIRPPLPDARSR